MAARRTRRGFLTEKALRDGYFEERAWDDEANASRHIITLRHKAYEPPVYLVEHIIDRNQEISVLFAQVFENIHEARECFTDQGAER